MNINIKYNIRNKNKIRWYKPLPLGWYQVVVVDLPSLYHSSCLVVDLCEGCYHLLLLGVVAWDHRCSLLVDHAVYYSCIVWVYCSFDLSVVCCVLGFGSCYYCYYCCYCCCYLVCCHYVVEVDVQEDGDWLNSPAIHVSNERCNVYRLQVCWCFCVLCCVSCAACLVLRVLRCVSCVACPALRVMRLGVLRCHYITPPAHTLIHKHITSQYNTRNATQRNATQRNATQDPQRKTRNARHATQE